MSAYKSFNRLFDPLLLSVGMKWNMQKLHVKFKDSEVLPSALYCNTISIPTIKHKIVVNIDDLDRIKNFDILAQAVHEKTGIRISQEFFLPRLIGISSKADVWKDVLLCLKPKAIFVVAYYGRFHILKAASDLKIPVIDFQHGKQGKNQVMFSHWKRLPKEGYELLPDWFWNWGQHSVYNIEQWMPKHSVHRCVVGGSPWHNMWVEGYDATSEQLINEFDIIRKGKRTILVALAKFNMCDYELLAMTMKQSPHDWLWLLRFHPYHRGEEVKFLQLLVDMNITNYEVHFSNEMHLFSLLKRVDHCVTYHSTVCIEALDFNVRTTLIDHEAAELFPEYIDNRLFSLALTPKEIISCITEAFKLKLNTNTISKNAVFINSDKNTASNAMRTIMRSTAYRKPIRRFFKKIISSISCLFKSNFKFDIV